MRCLGNIVKNIESMQNEVINLFDKIEILQNQSGTEDQVKLAARK